MNILKSFIASLAGGRTLINPITNAASNYMLRVRKSPKSKRVKRWRMKNRMARKSRQINNRKSK